MDGVELVMWNKICGNERWFITHYMMLYISSVGIPCSRRQESYAKMPCTSEEE